jgi:HlyD family secretion protein
MQKKITIGILLLALLTLLFWAFRPVPAEVETATVVQGRFERAVQEDGKTRLRERYVVSTPLSGRVARMDLKQGDVVERDTVVATVWPMAPALVDARARAEQLARIGAMEAALARAQANVGRATAALAQSRAEFRRSEKLAQQGFVSPNQNETGLLNVQLKEKELESAQQEEDAAHHELEQSRAALQQFSQATPFPQQGTQRAFLVKAPVSGRVLKVLQQSEGTVLAGTPLMELGDPAQLEVVVDILTEDAAQIKPGATVQLTSWGGPEVLEGKVRLIEPAAFTKVSALGVEEQRVNVILDLTSPPEKWAALGDGFKVDVRVLVQVIDNAVQVPVSALFPLGGRSAVFTVEGGYARLHEVDVGARNGVDAWIKSGLTVGVKVIIYPDSKLKNGARVKGRQ